MRNDITYVTFDVHALLKKNHTCYIPWMLTPACFDTRNADAVEYLMSLEDESVDLVITDPAYESLEKYRKQGTTTRLKNSKGSSNKWFTIFPNRRFPELFEQIYRVLRMNGHFYMFSDNDTMFVAKPLAESAGFKFWKGIVWDKLLIGMGYHYRSRHELILFFEKGKRRLNDLSIPDILTAKRIWRGYPTEKPVPLIQTLVTQSSNPGELVCDPFLGSGSTGVAALLESRRFTGCDICDEALVIANQRMQETTNAVQPTALGGTAVPVLDSQQ